MMSESDADYLRRLARDIGLHRPRGLVPQGKAMCNIADRFESLLAENRDKDALIQQAIAALESLDVDALGYGQAADSQGDVYHWPLRDELLSGLKGGVSTLQSPCNHQITRFDDPVTRCLECGGVLNVRD